MLFYYIFTECVIPDVLNNRTHVKSTKGRVLLYPEITPPTLLQFVLGRASFPRMQQTIKQKGITQVHTFHPLN